MQTTDDARARGRLKSRLRRVRARARRFWPALLELVGLALLVRAGWIVSEALGTAIAGVGLVLFAYTMDGGGR